MTPAVCDDTPAITNDIQIRIHTDICRSVFTTLRATGTANQCSKTTLFPPVGLRSLKRMRNSRTRDVHMQVAFARLEQHTVVIFYMLQHTCYNHCRLRRVQFGQVPK